MANFIFIINLSPPIPTLPHTSYYFNLDESSKYVIYSFKNEIDSTNADLVFRFGQVPTYDSKLFLYYNKNDISDNIGSFISYNSETGEFKNSFHSESLMDLNKKNMEVVLNSSNCNSEYLKPGYIYAVISIVSEGSQPEYNGEFLIFSSQYIPEISTSKLYEYFNVGGPYSQIITYFIPKISEDTLLRLSYYCTPIINKYIRVYQNDMTQDPYNNTRIYNNFDDYIYLPKGFSYYIQFPYGDKRSFQEEILFQFPSNELIKIEEGKVIYTSTLLDNKYYYFYYDSSKMNVGDSLYLKIVQKKEARLYYNELISNDYKYIYDQRNPNQLSDCSSTKKEIDNTMTHFFKCDKKKADTKAFLLILRTYQIDRSFPNQQIEIFKKKNMTNLDELKRNCKKGEIVYYTLKLNDLVSYNKNILIYSSGNKALNIYCFDFDITYQLYRNYNYRFYEDIKLFYLDPLNPETEKFTDNTVSGFYSIFLYNPSLTEYSLDIKFIDKTIYFIKEFISPLQEKLIRKSYYNNITSNMNIYQSMRYEELNGETVEKYSIVYQELYGNFETEMIVLDNIKCKTIDEFLNDDFSFHSEYTTPLSDISILGKYIFTHIKINSQKLIPSFYDHIAFYENILKMNYTYPERISEGEEIVLFLELGKPTVIYFNIPYTEFNYEIKFLGRANSSEYNVNINICEENQKILNYENKIIRGRCKNVNEKSNIMLTKIGKALTGVIIKRALPKEAFVNIITDSIDNYIELYNKLTLVKFEKSIENFYYFETQLLALFQSNKICIHQEYSDIDYMTYPLKYSCYIRAENYSSYQNLSADYDMIYGENTASGRIIESDTLYLIVNSSKTNTKLYFRKMFKINVTDMESKDILGKKNFDGIFYIMPRKHSEKNYNHIFLQVSKKTSDKTSYIFYKDSEIINQYNNDYNDFYKNFDISEINEENQFLLYIKQNTDSVFRYKLYNSEDELYYNYDYKKNLITNNGFRFKVTDPNDVPVKIEIKPNYPQEIEGCSNYYFFVFTPEYNPPTYFYIDFKFLDSSVFFQNFTAKNVCSYNSKFLEEDLYKFTFSFKLKKSGTIYIIAFSEQVKHFNAIKFLNKDYFTYEYKESYGYPITLDLNENILFDLDEEKQETTMYNITFNDDGLLNIFWKGSDSNKVQKVLIYKTFTISNSNLLYNSLSISNFEHNYSFKALRRSKNLIVYTSQNDVKNRTIYFEFTHRLGKEFRFNNIDNSNWIVYTSGTYKFYTKIDINDKDIENKINAFRYRLKNQNYDSISSIEISYLDENEILIKSFEIQGNVNKKFIDSENRIFYYFTLDDNFKDLITKYKLNYIQVVFNLKFQDEGGPEALDELMIERKRVKKIKDKNWKKTFIELINESWEEYGIYYIDGNEEIFNSKQNILFYTNVKNISNILYYGNFLDFTSTNDIISHYVHNIERQLFVFNEETKDNYITKNNDNIIMLLIDGKKDNKELYSKNEFLEFKFQDASINIIKFNENGSRSNIFKQEETFQITNEGECAKTNYFISYYSNSEEKKTKIVYSENKYGTVDFYYINEKSIFSDSVSSIEDILPDNSNKYLINQHPNEIITGGLDIFVISCKKAPALAILYSFDNEEQDNKINFSFDNNGFIGYMFPEDLNKLKKTYYFQSQDEVFKSKLKILKVIGFSNIDIKYGKNDNSDIFTIIKEGDEIIIESNKENPTFKIDENGIGKGVLFFEIIKELPLDDEKIYINYENIFNKELKVDNYAILKYDRKKIESQGVKLILSKEIHKTVKICIKYDFFTEPFISLPDCKDFIELVENSYKSIIINNPYITSTNFRLITEAQSDFYTIIKPDSQINYIYSYSHNPESLSFNSLKDISGSGEFNFELENGSLNKRYILYQINKCNPNKKVYLSFGSENYKKYDNNIYGIQAKDSTNMNFSIINEGESNGEKDLYFVISESNNNVDIIKPNAIFFYRQIENSIVFTVQNFAEEEFEYYSIITQYNSTENLSNFCFFNEFFKNRNLYSKNISIGGGLNSETNITHNIDEECFSQNCTIMVFAKSTTSNLSKIYTPITLNVLKKYIKPIDKKDKDENKDKDDSSSSIIIILVSIIVILIVVIGIFVFIKIKKSKNKINIYDNKNSSTINEMNILTPDFKSDNESIDKPGMNKPINKPKPNYLNPLIEDEENQLPNESDITKETTPDSELKRVGTGINLEDAPPII